MLVKLKEQHLYQDLNWRLILVGLTSSLGALAFGFDNGWWGGALGLSEFQKRYGNYDASKNRWVIPSERLSVGTGTGSAGIILGCVMAPHITSRFGRKIGFATLSSLMIIGTILETTALHSFWQLIVGRIILYSGIGIASNVVPMYLSECSPPRVRGAFLALYSFFTSFGVFMATLTVYLSRQRNDQWQYLIVMICQLFAPLGYLITYPFLPESPRYLISRGKFEEAEVVMRKLYNHPERISEELELLKLQVEEQREMHKATSMLDCFRGTNLRRTVAAMGCQVLQQAQGVSFIQNFIVVFMQQLGFPDALRTNVLVTGCGFVAHFVTFITFDKLGRRNSLILGAVGMAATMIGTGGATSTGNVSDLSPAVQNACAAMLILWYCIFGFTWGPGCWVVTGEIGTGQLRERTIFLASMGSFVTSVPINFINPFVQRALGGKVTFIYGGFSVAAIAFVWFLVPETNRRSLEELDEMFQDRVPTLKFKSHVCTGIGAQITSLGAKSEGAEEQRLDDKRVKVVEREVA